MAKIVAIIQARTGSTRLPGKVLKEIIGEPMLGLMIERVKMAKKIDKLVIATSQKSTDDVIESISDKYGACVFRGSEKNVLDRFYKAAKKYGAEIVVRMTGDCPLIDPKVIDEVVNHLIEEDVDYTNTPSNYPEGLDVEAFRFKCLETAWKNAKLPSEIEHVTAYIKNHKELFTVSLWKKGDEDFSYMHWSVDTPEDFIFVDKIFEENTKTSRFFSKEDVLDFLRKNSHLLEINKGNTGYEGYKKSLKDDEDFKIQH